MQGFIVFIDDGSSIVDRLIYDGQATDKVDIITCFLLIENLFLFKNDRRSFDNKFFSSLSKRISNLLGAILL